MITFHQLKQFLALADTLHFGRTARQLGISQAALSRTVAALENALGFQLLDREDRHAVRLTGAGRMYAERCRALLAELESVEDSARSLAQGRGGRLDIQLAGGAVSCPEVMQLLQKMRHEYPGIQIQIKEAGSVRQLLASLASRECQAGIAGDGLPPVLPEEVIYRDLARHEEPGVLVFPAHHPVLAAARPDSLKTCHFILPPPDAAPELVRKFRAWFVQQFRQEPVTALECGSWGGIMQMAASGLGVGVMSRQDAALLPGVVIRELPFPVERRVVLMCSTGSSLPTVASLLACAESFTAKNPGQSFRKR